MKSNFSFNEDIKDKTFKDIDSILSDNVEICFFHTSNAGMIDLGNYEVEYVNIVENVEKVKLNFDQIHRTRC